MRYVHLYFTCIKRSMISRLEYKKDTIVALFSFFFSNLCSLAAIYFILQAIPALSGYSLPEVGFFYGFSMLPIAFFPKGLRDVVSWMPFAGMSQNPVLILMMKYDLKESLRCVALSVAWIVVLELFAKLLFSHAVRKVTVHGG